MDAGSRCGWSIPLPNPRKLILQKFLLYIFCKPHNKVQIFFLTAIKKMGHNNDMWTRYFIAMSMGSKNCKNSDISNQNKLKLGVFFLVCFEILKITKFIGSIQVL